MEEEKECEGHSYKCEESGHDSEQKMQANKSGATILKMMNKPYRFSRRLETQDAQKLQQLLEPPSP